MKFLALILALSVTGCKASGTTMNSDDAGVDDAAVMADDGVVADAGQDASMSAPTFSVIYPTYFGPSSLGHCGSCHGGGCQSSKSACYSWLTRSGFIDTANPTQSPIADPQQTPLVWYGGGFMPPGGSRNATAASDITAWVQAGAQNN